MNISQHSFVASRFRVPSSGNYQSFWDYYYSGAGFCHPFPATGKQYAFYLSPGSSPSYSKIFPILPFQLTDYTNPKKFVLILF